MSSASDEDDREEDLDLFHEFIEEIGGQINKRVFRIMKRLSRNKIPQGKLESFEDPADLITALEETNIICRTNTTYLAHILRVANENKLAKQVEEYPLKHHKGMKRKRTSTDSDVPYKRKYMDIPVPIMVEGTPKDRALYWAAVTMFNRTMERIASSNLSVKMERKQMSKAFKDLDVNLAGVKISSVILIARCWDLNGFLTFKYGLKHGQLEESLTKILITDEMKALVADSGITLRIVAKVDPSVMEKAEKYFREVDDETTIFADAKTTSTIQSLDPMMKSLGYLNLMSMTYPQSPKIESFNELTYRTEQVSGDEVEIGSYQTAEPTYFSEAVDDLEGKQRSVLAIQLDTKYTTTDQLLPILQQFGDVASEYWKQTEIKGTVGLVAMDNCDADMMSSAIPEKAEMFDLLGVRKILHIDSTYQSHIREDEGSVFPCDDNDVCKFLNPPILNIKEIVTGRQAERNMKRTSLRKISPQELYDIPESYMDVAAYIMEVGRVLLKSTNEKCAKLQNQLSEETEAVVQMKERLAERMQYEEKMSKLVACLQIEKNQSEEVKSSLTSKLEELDATVQKKENQIKHLQSRLSEFENEIKELNNVHKSELMKAEVSHQLTKQLLVDEKKARASDVDELKHRVKSMEEKINDEKKESEKAKSDVDKSAADDHDQGEKTQRKKQKDKRKSDADGQVQYIQSDGEEHGDDPGDGEDLGDDNDGGDGNDDSDILSKEKMQIQGKTHKGKSDADEQGTADVQSDGEEHGDDHSDVKEHGDDKDGGDGNGNGTSGTLSKKEVQIQRKTQKSDADGQNTADVQSDGEDLGNDPSDGEEHGDDDGGEGNGDSGIHSKEEVQIQRKTTPLHVAALQRNVEEVKRLCISGASIDALDENRNTPLNLACLKGYDSVVEVLVNYGAVKNIKEQYEKTALHNACEGGNIKVINILTSAGWVIEARDDKGFTALLWASQLGEMEIIKELIKLGADIHARTNNESNCLHTACGGGSNEAVKYFLDKNYFGLEDKNKNGRTALAIASRKGHVEVVKTLLSSGALIESKDKLGQTALVVASGKGHVEVVKTLLSAGALIESKDEGGFTALLAASQFGKMEIVKELIKLGADIHARTNLGQTALVVASGKGHVEVVKTLLSAGALIESKDEGGFTALLAASQFGKMEIVKELIKLGADIHARTNYEDNCLHAACIGGSNVAVKYFLDKNYFGLEDKNKLGRTALAIASIKGHVEVVKTLISSGALINTKDEEDETPLTLACGFGRSLEVVKDLLLSGAFIEAKDKDNRTALYLASRKGHSSIVKLLIDHGADVLIKSKYGRTCLEVACREKHTEVEKILLAAGADMK